MKSNVENKLLAVVRIRGRMGVRRDIQETMDRLNLTRVNSLVVIYGTKSAVGMIKKVGDFVAYGEITADMLERILSEKGGKATKDDIASIMGGKKNPAEAIGMPIRLKPPRHGYEGIKHSFSNGGALGYRGDKINALLNRMV